MRSPSTPASSTSARGSTDSDNDLVMHLEHMSALDPWTKGNVSLPDAMADEIRAAARDAASAEHLVTGILIPSMRFINMVRVPSDNKNKGGIMQAKTSFLARVFYAIDEWNGKQDPLPTSTGLREEETFSKLD